MSNRVLEFIRSHRPELVDGLVARIRLHVPQYGRMPGPELRQSVEGFVDDVLMLIEERNTSGLSQRLVEVSQRRIAQGFSPGDFLRAIFAVYPLLRDHVRRHGPANDPDFAREYGEIEAMLNETATTAANVYAETTTRVIESKNQALNNLNGRLAAHERALSREVKEAIQALESAQQFSARVIDSLSAGVLAVEAKGRTITYVSSRAEEILGIAAEKILGQPIGETIALIEGVQLEDFIGVIHTSGRLPLTKAHLGLPDGRRRWVYLRAERLYGPDGEPEGTVVVLEDITERELLVDSFSRYVSRDVVDRVLARGEIRMEGERRVCSILFADVRGFSSIAEHLAPELLHEMLNAYFHVMIEAITEQGGFIDKFMGDKVMAIFGAGAAASQGAHAAVKAARIIRDRIEGVNVQREAEGRLRIEIGVGINTGEVLLGNVGSKARMDFTAIGDMVNVADRLQAMAAPGEILLGAATFEALGPDAGVRSVGAKPIRGRSQTVDVYAT